MWKFRKKPLIIEAKRLCEPYAPDDIANWCGGRICSIGGVGANLWIEIETLEGVMKAEYGDWIIKGVRGEFYPCKSDIFEETYEFVSE